MGTGNRFNRQANDSTVCSVREFLSETVKTGDFQALTVQYCYLCGHRHRLGRNAKAEAAIVHDGTYGNHRAIAKLRFAPACAGAWVIR